MNTRMPRPALATIRRLIAAICLVALAWTAPASSQPPPVTWAFEPPTDQFNPGALLDLRSLNEKTAGESGFVRATPAGDFALGNGKPVRFWAVAETIQNADGMDAVTHKARWLAKRGVNMVRVHSVLAPTADGSKITAANQQEIDRIWKLVAAMKREGIYTTVSPYWAIPVKILPSWNVPGGAGHSAAALLFWDRTMQEGYRAWLRALYEPPNTYTGVPLSREPAVAIIQLQNEDSMLFWTMQEVAGDQLKEVCRRFGAWLQRRYGSLEQANTAWGGEHPAPDEFQDKQGDAFAEGRAGIYIVWHWTQPQTGYRARRLADQLAFFTDTMRRFNADTADYLRKTLGCKQLINAGNWRPADPVRLFDAERYSYAANDVMAVNRYFTGQHEGRDNGWAIRPGDRYTDNSALLDPRGLPTSVKQPVGFPFIVSETEWVAPTRYQSEGPFLTAAYQSLTGVDISYFFSDGDGPEWQPPFLPLPWNPPTGKWAIATPMQLGQFPAAALMFRQGYLQRGKTAVHEERALEDIWQRRSPLIAEEAGFDPNRDAGDLPLRSAVKAGVDPLAFLVGPVEVVYGGDPAKSAVLDIAPYVDTANRKVTAVTGEVRLDYGTGLCVVDAPRAQGASGFLRRAGAVKTADTTIRSRNDYATISVVSMDGLPVASSRKLLIQIGTTARPTGWEDREATWKSGDGKQTFVGREVVSTGRNPWQIVSTDATVEIRNPVIRTAQRLDANGEAAGAIAVERRGTHLTVTLPADALYVVLQ